MVRLAKATVGVIGSGTDEHVEHAHPVGDALAELGVNLLTGGGGGVMRAVSRAFTRSPHPRGICIGIIPCASRSNRATPKPGYPNEFVELAIFTHLPYSGEQGTDDLSRNHINVLSCAAIVALPGEAGTLSEVSLAVRYGKQVVAYSPSSGFAQRIPASVRRVDGIDDVKAFLRLHLDVSQSR
jgi:uncharacterized protein (TIGR00725 family)